jgi:hypothetical protein
MRPKKFKRVAGRLSGFVVHREGQIITGTVVERRETELAPYWKISVDRHVVVRPTEKGAEPITVAPGSLVGIQGTAYNVLDTYVGDYVLIEQGPEIDMGRGKNNYKSAEVFVADEDGDSLASFGLDEPRPSDDIPF